LKLDPNSQIAILVLAQVSPSSADALAAFDKFLERNPASHEVRRAYAGMLAEQKYYSQARIQLEILTKNKPQDQLQDPTILYALGVLSFQMKDSIAAEKNLIDFVQLLEASPNQQGDPTSAYLYLSQIADDRNDGVTALHWLAKIQPYEGKNAAYFNAQLRHAVLIAKYNSVEHAQKFLHELKTSRDEKIDVVRLEIDLLRNANREAEANALLKVTTEAYPNNLDLLYDFAMIAEKRHHFEEMETTLRHIIKIDPENRQAYNALGYSLVERNNRLAEARVLLEKALSLAPDDAFIIDSMGWLEFKEHRNERALAFLQRAFQLRPDPDIAAHFGEVLWVMGEQQKAKAIWKEAQKKEPNNATLKSTLERLKVGL
jgi:tetratricopeptide (TPR) repeat protein